ncbi:MAG: chlororespiratory reduction protein 7 [Cyanobacteria bacterium P01_A01_bin.17]
MPDQLMYSEDMYVMIETGQPEQFLTAAEMLSRLESLLQQYPEQAEDLQHLPTLTAQAQHLLNTGCELDIGEGQYLQWYAVRLEK